MLTANMLYLAFHSKQFSPVIVDSTECRKQKSESSATRTQQLPDWNHQQRFVNVFWPLYQCIAESSSPSRFTKSSRAFGVHCEAGGCSEYYCCKGELEGCYSTGLAAFAFVFGSCHLSWLCYGSGRSDIPWYDKILWAILGLYFRQLSYGWEQDRKSLSVVIKKLLRTWMEHCRIYRPLKYPPNVIYCSTSNISAAASIGGRHSATM